MFELSIRTHFSAAHRLPGYDGPCAEVHGHNWEVEVYVRGAEVNGLGMVMDFGEIKREVRLALEELDHRDLNALPFFTQSSPSSENLARHLHAALSRRLNGPRCRVHKVTVHETPGTSASYWDEADG